MSDERFEQLCDVAGPVSRETFRDLNMLGALLEHWNQRINLVSPATLPDLWDRHIIDSAQLFPLARGAETWTDLGSGGGFPGLALACLIKGAGRGRIELVESNRKKTAFLITAVARLHLPARVAPERIEIHIEKGVRPEIVTARALANLTQLLDWCAPWLSAGTRALFHKGREYQGELAESRQHWEFDLVEHPSRVDGTGVILEISRLRPRRGTRT
ncbi:MAG: 16S rRNA (guanine(527)-N(7))-methyltransferase RsmG [Rhizobiaceae bacterium]|nr:16S rRNA (guanine(527)-N(7))-methyltransferase RsmG [Rhizobiaceae bacterium]